MDFYIDLGVALMEGQHIAGAMREYLRKYYRIFVVSYVYWLLSWKNEKNSSEFEKL